MEIIGIIGEFDPFHRGHAHLIARGPGGVSGKSGGLRHERPFTRGAGRPLCLNMPGRRWHFAAGRT